MAAPTIAHGEADDVRINVKLPMDAKVTRPPFSRPGIEQSYYDVADPAMRNASLPLPALTAWVTADYDGVEIRLGQVIAIPAVVHTQV